MQLKILPTIKSPEDLRKLNKDQLLQLADELRHFTIETITEIGGASCANLRGDRVDYCTT